MNKLSIAGFTNLGYLLHARGFQPIATDMSGKTVVITGATGGLGKAAAGSLVTLGARVIAVGRDQAKLVALKAEVGGEVATIQTDLSLVTEVRDLGTRLVETEPHIDVLVNNVGVLLPERLMTDERLEATLATNLAGHFLLTNLLIPRLIQSSPARIVNVSSGGMYAERIRPDDLQFERDPYVGSSAYARTKRGQVILTGMWAERLAGTGVGVHAMHPGWAKTAGVERSLPTFNKLMKPLLRTAAQGADTIVWLAAGDEPGRSSGQFWFDRKVVPTHLSDSTRETAEDREALWAALVAITGSDLA